ncbi:hypothetical protein FZC78_21890 [Rossellomorea vietnamensis]|uniref:Uncharacterized protein n=1 Tax=Rossellomorea vietnamensis TaxID=218284 RepID=A0A5D4NHU7_9BACI|nr:hypothetical protein [Rossellomorea vietnamensis]TYS13334.1 hypothetical protein FZC78_21890 [Rossellomorea vietnamensis]
MANNNQSVKVAVDMSFLQLIWSAWFMSFVFTAYLILQRVVDNERVNEQSFLTFIYGPSKIYMLVIGIISVYAFLTFYVKNGVTRRDYFKGAAVSSVVVSLVLMTIAGIIAAIEQVIDPDIVTSSFVGPDASLLVTVLAFSINILASYTAGWLIGAGFYRFGGMGGMLYIFASILILSLLDFLWESELKEPLKFLLDISHHHGFSATTSFILTAGLLAVTLWIIKSTTKRVQIKLK